MNEQCIYIDGGYTRIIPSNKLPQEIADKCPTVRLTRAGLRYREARPGDNSSFESKDVSSFYHQYHKR